MERATRSAIVEILATSNRVAEQVFVSEAFNGGENRGNGCWPLFLSVWAHLGEITFVRKQ